MRRPTRGPRMGHRGVEQGARQLSAEVVTDLEPAIVQHVLSGGCQLQQAGRRATEQGRAIAEHPHAAINLDGEPVRQAGPTHVSIPSGPGAHRTTRRTHPSTISAKMRLPSAAVAVVGSPSTPTRLTAATPPRRIGSSNSGKGARLPGSHRSVSTSVGEIWSNSDVSVWPAWASPPAAAHGDH